MGTVIAHTQPSPLARFHARTFTRSRNLGKDLARTELVKIYTETASGAGVKSHRIITLPGVWWHFERQLGEALSNQKQNPGNFLGFERDPKLFLLSSSQMASRWGHRSGGINSRYDKKTSCDIASTMDGHHVLHNWDALDYLIDTPRGNISCVWLDLCSPITSKLLLALASIPRCATPGYLCLAITVMVGREVPEITAMIQEAGSREALLSREVRLRCGTGFGLADSRSYVDGAVRMLQMTFVRSDEGEADFLEASPFPHDAYELQGRGGHYQGWPGPTFNGAWKPPVPSPPRQRPLRVGDRVVMSLEGLRRLGGKYPSGIVVGESRDKNCFRVLRDGLKIPVTYHRDFWMAPEASR